MTRTAVACFVLAAAIATPGIVVAATHSSGQQPVRILGSGSAQLHPLYVAPIVDSRLRPAVAGIRRALRARGEKDMQTIWSADEAEIMQTGNSERPCPVHVQVTVVKGAGIQMWDTSPGCRDNTIRRGKLRVTYSPLSLGIAIRKGLATLPR